MAPLLRLLFLLPPLLLPSSPVLGNEGAAAGSCKCPVETEEPRFIKSHPHKLQSCQTCPGGKLRFQFPKFMVCGYETVAWAQNFWKASCGKARASLPEDSRQVMRAEASRPHQAPTPSSATAVPTETNLDPGRGTSEEVPRTQLAPGRTTDAPWTPERTTSTPATDGVPSGAGQEEASPHLGAGGSHRVVVMSLIGVVLALVAVVVLVVCRRRRRGRGKHLAHYCTSGHPGEEVRYLPCDET